MVVDFEQESAHIEKWQNEQGWKIRNPFVHITDPKLFVGFDDILKKLYRFAAMGKNYAVVYGQYGYGKTAVVKKIANEFQKKYNIILFEDVPDREYIAKRLKSLCGGKLLRKLTRKDIDTFDYVAFNKLIKNRTILIFDEAHSIDEKVFSYIRSLSENGTTFTTIFAGKPEVISKEAGLPQYLLDRLELLEGLRPFDENESIELVKKRVQVLAESDNYLFTDKAIKLIGEKSRHIPREILENCSKYVDFSIQEGIHKVDERIIENTFKYVGKETSIPIYEIQEMPEERIGTLERMMEGEVPVFVPRASAYNIEKQIFLGELSPLQKRIVIYVFKNEPKTAPEIAMGLSDKYDTVRHMLKRLQGKYGEKDVKKKISDLFPLVDERENPSGRGYVYSLSTQVRKIMSLD